MAKAKAKSDARSDAKSDPPLDEPQSDPKSDPEAEALSAEPEAAPAAKSQFEDGPWAVKLVAGSDKKLAFDAAKRRRITIGDWLGEAIRAYVASERDDERFDIMAPGQTRGQTAGGVALLEQPPPLSIEDVGRAVEIAKEIARLRGKQLPPNAKLLVGAQRVLMRRLLQG
jgi:hypothetical protein